MALKAKFVNALTGGWAIFFRAEGRTGNGCGQFGSHHTSARPKYISGLALRIGAAGALVCLSSCAHENAGIRVYEPVVTRAADGGERSAARLVASISGDMAGVESVTVGRVRIEFGPGGSFLTSPVITAQGTANRETIDAIAAGVTGGILSVGGVGATAGTVGALGALVP